MCKAVEQSDMSTLRLATIFVHSAEHDKIKFHCHSVLCNEYIKEGGQIHTLEVFNIFILTIGTFTTAARLIS